MTSSPSRTLIIGALAGLLVGWLLPMLLGPPIAAWAPSLWESPRLSDAIVGAGGLLVYISEAPGMYLAGHMTRELPAEPAVNALGWTLAGLAIGGLVVTIRGGRALAAGALAGLLAGWMAPAICATLGECFRHCWMHEGLLGEIALAGGTALRAVGLAAELPWRLIAGAPEGVTPMLAAPVSAALWTLAGVACGAVVMVVRRPVGARGDAPEGARHNGGEPAV